MKKMRKLLAVLMTLAMVMGLGMTSFAADADPNTGNITVKGLNANEVTTVKIYQVVSHSADGSVWTVADWATGKVNLATNPVGINWTDLKALAEADSSTAVVAATKTAAVGATEVVFEDLAIGAYLIVASGSEGAYNPMGTALYTYDETTHLITAPAENRVVWAKYSDYKVTKEVNDENDSFVARGDEVSFDITATFPSFPVLADGKAPGTFSVTDTPTGLKITGVEVKVAGEVVAATNYKLDKELPTDAAVTVAFTEAYIGTANAQAGKSVVITITAVVTADDGYANSANTSEGDVSSQVLGFTGDATITKYAFEKENDNTLADNQVLTGAEFKVYPAAKSAVEAAKKTEDTTDDIQALYFVRLFDGVYKLANATEANATQTIVVASEGTNKGKVQVKGLDEGTYWFEETKAPKGYSINTDGVEIEIEEKVDDQTTTTVDESKANVSVVGNLVDTKLNALPSTGGIGTTIFTIGGCAIMVAAAYMFFASRRREDEQ